MQIELHRQKRTRWGVDGELSINGSHIADTTEHPTAHLASGTYPITMQCMLLKRGNGPLLNIDGSICVGEHCCSGCVINSGKIFSKLYYRIRKTLERGNQVSLVIKSVLIAILLTGCSTSRNIKVVEHSVHDTLYLNHIQYDSIYVDNWHSTDRSKDTVYIHDILRENHYKLLRDTVRIAKVDTIPVIHKVEVPVKYVPAVYKWSLVIVIVIVIVLTIYLVWKIKF